MSSSILTNMSAMSALQSLNMTQKSLANTQSQISTGLRIQTASDNAAYWSISTQMKSDTSALSAVSDALNLGSSVLGVATAAVNSTLSVMYKLKQDLVTAQTPGTSLAQVQTDVVAQQQSLLGILSSASFNGVNLLDGSAGGGAAGATTSFVSSFSRNAAGNTNVGTITIATGTVAGATGGTQLTGSAGLLALPSGTAIPSANGTGASNTTGALGPSGTYAASSILGFALVGGNSPTTGADLTTLSANIDAAISAITSVGAALGSAQTNIDNQSTFVTALTSAITSGVGSLIDADMNQASTRLSALQTQQQLGVQALSIANQNSQLILKLFQ